MPTVLIVGASRGIGRGFVTCYHSRGWEVHATVRNPADSIHFPNGVVSHLMDVTSREQIDEASSRLRDKKIDLLIHNAGVGKGTPEELMMRINTDAPFTVIEAFLPQVLASEQKKIAIMSSQLGSRERFGGGSTPVDAYGKSKCLLNDRFRASELAWREMGLTSVVVHPGWVITDMGGPSAALTVDQSVCGMFDLLSALCPSQSGGFYTFEGKAHPW